jgi:hypothetical protein
MSESNDQQLQRAIETLSQTDPIVKLLQQVKLGRMKPTDAGLQVVTESWLGTYRQVIQRFPPAGKHTLQRLDPEPRLEVLIQAGVVANDYPAVVSLRQAFQQALDGAGPQAGSSA